MLNLERFPDQLSEAADVTVLVYSVNGNLIRTLALGHQSPTAGDFTATRKMLIRK